MIKVRIPTPLRKLTGGQGEVMIQAETIAGLVNNLEQHYPGIKERLCDEQGDLRRFINLYVNQEDIRFRQGIATSLQNGDDVSIVPAIAGGAQGSETVAHVRVHVSFPEDKVKEPVIYEIGRDFNVVTNIRKADVTERMGWVDLELSGDPSEIERALAGLKGKGVHVDPIEKNVIE